jgi:hypothetical protein
MTLSIARVVAVLGTLALTVACVATPKAVTPHRLVVKAYIDGSDFLMMRGNQLRWVHRGWELPGLDEAKEPTFLNGTAWWPKWQNGLVSLPTTVADPLPSSPPGQVRLVATKARGSVIFAEQPSSQNDHSLTVLFDDDGIVGADWYEIALEWDLR